MITERQILPGEKIPQEKLAQELGISRTPLVSALKFFELREVLEGLAAKRAAANITDKEIEILNGFFRPFSESTNITDFRAYAKEDRRFHNFITEIGAKEFLKSILQTYNFITASYQYLSSEGLVRPPNETIEEHLAVIKAIGERDPDAAEELMRRHLNKTIAHLRQDIEKETQGMGGGKIIRPSF
jgi:DNA-binding GntR family transcriptional regulator